MREIANAFAKDSLSHFPWACHGYKLLGEDPLWKSTILVRQYVNLSVSFVTGYVKLTQPVHSEFQTDRRFKRRRFQSISFVRDSPKLVTKIIVSFCPGQVVHSFLISGYVVQHSIAVKHPDELVHRKYRYPEISARGRSHDNGAFRSTGLGRRLEYLKEEKVDAMEPLHHQWN